MDIAIIILKIYLLAYTAACARLAFAQPTRVATIQFHSSGNRAAGFLSNILVSIIFALIYYSNLIIVHYQLAVTLVLVGVIIHHIVRALYSLKSYEDDMYEPSMRESVINMVLYVASLFLVPLVLL